MDISLLATIDETTKRIEGKVIPLTVDALDQARRNDSSFREYLFPRFYNRGYDPTADNMILNISFDPTSCGIPISHCCGRCAECPHNPLPVLFEPYMNTKPRNYVITGSDTVCSMLDTIEMLAMLNKSRLR